MRVEQALYRAVFVLRRLTRRCLRPTLITVMSELLSYELSESIATITMDDGKANAMSSKMLAAIASSLDQAERDEATVVIAGREGMFSAGFDLSVFTQGSTAVYEMLKAGGELVERVLTFPRPVVVACTGHCIAMGAFLTMSADQRIGAQGKFKVMTNEVAIGMTVPWFGIEVSRLRLSPSYFNRAMITAESFSPEQAVDAGFLDRIVPATDVLKEARGVALAASKLNMQAHAATKLRVRQNALSALREGTKQELGSEEAFMNTIGHSLVR